MKRRLRSAFIICIVLMISLMCGCDYQKREKITLDKSELTVEYGETFFLVANIPSGYKASQCQWSFTNGNVEFDSFEELSEKELKVGFVSNNVGWERITATLYGVTVCCDITILPNDKYKEKYEAERIEAEKEAAKQRAEMEKKAEETRKKQEEEAKKAAKIILHGDVEITLSNDIPETFSTYSLGEIEQTYKITSVSAEKDAYGRVWFYVSGIKTFDIDGKNHSSRCRLGWKLYDDFDKSVIDSGTVFSPGLAMEEKFNKADGFIGKLESGNYTLTLLSSE